MASVDYVYNRPAAEMRSMTSRILGLVVANVRNPYFAELTMAIEGTPHPAGCTMSDARRRRRAGSMARSG